MPLSEDFHQGADVTKKNDYRPLVKQTPTSAVEFARKNQVRLVRNLAAANVKDISSPASIHLRERSYVGDSAPVGDAAAYAMGATIDRIVIPTAIIVSVDVGSARERTQPKQPCVSA